MLNDRVAERDGAELRFERLYSTYAGRVLAYALRRIDVDAAQDVAADVFAVAWRRIDSVPEDAALPWLFAVARKTIANQHRATRRHRALADRLQVGLSPDACDVQIGRGDTSEVLEALASLSERDREVLLLVAWDGLSPGEAAVALECSPVACRLRLHRARRKLRRAIEADSNGAPNPALVPQHLKETPDA